MTAFPKFAYQDGKVLAFHDDKLIASGTEFAKVAETAEEYFSSLRQAQAQRTRQKATHVTTPNGRKGQILGKTPTIWGDEITVRMDNGEIKRLATAPGDESLTYSTEEAPKASTYMEYFENRWNEGFNQDSRGLTARLDALDEIQQGIRGVMASVSHTEREQLDRIAMQADAESREIGEVLAHLAQADIEAFAPFVPQVVEQAGMGRAASDSWLDVTARQMIAESEAEDFDKLLEEGPTKLVSSLDNAALASAGTTAEYAREHIVAKTAGFQGEAVDDYRDRFVAASEMARRQEQTYRQTSAHEKTAKHEASIADVPDEALFL